MAVDTTRRITVELEPEMARLLWAVMHDDDGLAHDYLQLAVVHAANHIMEDSRGRWWSREQFNRIRNLLVVARIKALQAEEEMVNRFTAYAEPPF